MAGDIITWIQNNKTLRRKALEAAGRIGTQSSPIARTIQAGVGIVKMGETLNQVNGIAKGLNDFVPRAASLATRVDQFIPTMQVMGQSFCDSVKIISYFNAVATTVGIASNIVMAYQGIQAIQLVAARLQDINNTLQAQMALTAQKEFPEYVHDMLRERLDQVLGDPHRDHFFFLYHPDNDWYPKFHHLLAEKPLDPRFCGYTNQIDTVFVFMLAARRRIEEKEQKAWRRGKALKPVKLHLIIPAYQPILIAEALKIPEEIGDFVIEGRINSNREFVWLNLPEDQKHYTLDIGNWVPLSQGWWTWAMTRFGVGKSPPTLGEPRVLGTSQHALEYDIPQGQIAGAGDDDDADANTTMAVNGSEIASQAGDDSEKKSLSSAPLHHQRDQKPKKKRRKEPREARETREPVRR